MHSVPQQAFVAYNTISFSPLRVELPEGFRELSELQHALISTKMNDPESLAIINKFLDENPDLAIQEIHLAMRIRPKLYKEFTDLLMKFDNKTINMINMYECIPEPMRSTLIQNGKIQKSKAFIHRSIIDFYYLDEFDVDAIEALVDDNVQFFIDKYVLTQDITKEKIAVYGATRQLPLLAAAALYGAPKVFKYLFLNRCDITPLEASYAIAGGSTEIVRLVDQHFSLNDQEETALFNRQDDIFYWIADRKGECSIHSKIHQSQDLSIEALYSLSMSKKVQFEESLTHIYIIENNLLNEEIIASTLTYGKCYIATDPSQPIALYANQNNITTLLDASLQAKSIPHIKAALGSEFFNEEAVSYQNPITMIILLDCMKKSQEICNMIKSKVNLGKILYIYQKRNFPGKQEYISKYNIFELISFALSQNDTDFVKDLCKNNDLCFSMKYEEFLALDKYNIPEISAALKRMEQHN